MGNFMFWILFCIVLVNMCKSQVTMRYLHGGRRSNSSHYDYYFCCNTQGNRLEWIVNGDSVGGFVETNSKRVVAAKHSNYIYIYSLLSVEEIQQGVHQFDSIIMITLTSPDILTVNCRSNLGSSSTNNMMPNDLRRRNDTHSGIVIEQLFSGQVIPSTENMTYGFLCRGQEAYQTWTINNQQDQLAFANHNDVGFALPIIANGNPITLYRLAFISEVEPNEIVSVLFVTGSLGINVACSGPHSSAHLIADYLFAQTTTTTARAPTASSVSPVSPVTKSSSSSMMPTPPKEVDVSAERLPLVTAVVAPVAVIIIVVAVAVVAFVTTSIFLAQGARKRKKILDANKNVYIDQTQNC